jgi:hypothetical protein
MYRVSVGRETVSRFASRRGWMQLVQMAIGVDPDDEWSRQAFHHRLHSVPRAEQDPRLFEPVPTAASEHEASHAMADERMTFSLIGPDVLVVGDDEPTPSPDLGEPYIVRGPLSEMIVMDLDRDSEKLQ